MTKTRDTIRLLAFSFSLAVLLGPARAAQASGMGGYGSMGGADASFAIRPYGQLGYAAIANSDDSLAVGGGLQTIWVFGKQMSHLGLGLDVGHRYLPQAIDGENQIGALVFLEFNFIGLLAEVGLGPNFKLGDSTKMAFTVMVALGVDFASSDHLSLFGVIRADTVPGDNTLFSVGLHGGVSFYL